MHQMRDALRRPLAAMLATSAIAVVGLAACGSGSSSTGTQTNAAATATTSAGSGLAIHGSGTSTAKSGATGPGSARPRVTAIRECLQHNGVALPTRPGAARGLLLGGALPKGVSRAQLQAAMRKCLGGRFPGAGAAGQRFRRARSPRFQQALSAFAACLRKNGVAVPTPNTSGNGPVFSTKGLNTSSPQFKAATAKCRPVLAGVFGLRGARPGA